METADDNERNFIIFSDYKSALQAIWGRDWMHPLVMFSWHIITAFWLSVVCMPFVLSRPVTSISIRVVHLKTRGGWRPSEIFILMSDLSTLSHWLNKIFESVCQ